MTVTMAVSVAPGEQTTMPRRSLNQLQETAWRLSRHILEMTTIAGSGHPSSSLSAIDIMTGLMVAAALEAAQTLSGRGINARVIDMHTLKPLDAATIVRAAQETGALVTAEEHLLDLLSRVLSRSNTRRRWPLSHCVTLTLNRAKGANCWKNMG